MVFMNQNKTISIYNDFYATANFSKYAGEWIAILDNKVVSHNKNLKTLLKKTKEISPNVTPFITKIPLKEILIW